MRASPRRLRRVLLALALALAAAGGVEAATYYWTTWDSYSFNGTTHTLTGTITTASGTVTVTYTNTQGLAGYQLGNGTGGTVNYYSGGTDGAGGTSPYTSATVENRPDNATIVRLSNAGAQTLTFSENVSNLAFAFVSLNGNAFSFDRNFDILSIGDSSDGGNACGYWGCGTAAKVVGSGSYPYQVSGGGEPHGTLLFSGSFASLTWTSGNENWHGFTVGIAGTAGQVVDPGPSPTVAIDPADGTEHVALSANITMTFNKEVRNLNDTPLTSANVDGLITLKDGDASGADIPFDATIDDSNKVITINPSADFSADQVVYAAIGATVEDTYGNPFPASSATFTTGSFNQAPGAPSLLAPSSGDVLGSPLISFDWSDAVDPEGSPVNYEVRYSTAADFSAYASTSGLAASQFTPASALSDNTVYHWRVLASDLSGATAASATGTFTVNVAQTPPSVPSGMSPDGVVLSTTAVAFDWDDATDEDPGETFSYTIHFSTRPDFAVLTSSFNLTASSYTPSAGLLDNRVYYWRVVTTDGVGIVVPGPIVSFTVNTANDAPAGPALMDPVSSTTTDTTPLFDWTDALDVDPGDAVTYEIRYTTDVSFGVYTSSAGLTTSQYLPTAPLTADTTYYWLVYARDQSLAVSTSQTAGFIVVSGATPPPPSQLPATLERATAYPNPYRPGRGNPDFGTPYNGQPGSGITFDRLPAGSTVDLYTVTGELVRRLEAGDAGMAQWDVQNLTGQDVSSGAYVAVIRSPDGGRAIRKVLVIR